MQLLKAHKKELAEINLIETQGTGRFVREKARSPYYQLGGEQ